MDRREAGHTILEFVIGLGLTLALLMAVSTFYLLQNKIFVAEEKRLPAEHSARIAMNALVRDIRMAGHGRGTSSIVPVTGTASSITIRRYSTVAAVITPTDTSYAISNGSLLRTTPSGQSHITGNMRELVFTYRDSAGNITSDWNTVRRIDVRVTTNVPNPDLPAGAYSTYTLTESVMPPNLDF